MKRASLLRAFATLPLSFVCSKIFAMEACSVSPQAAVLDALGEKAAVASMEGYRVRDVVVDSVLHRAFVHVEQCGHPERPLMLLPFASRPTSPGPSILPFVAPSSHRAGAGESIVASGSLVAVAMGDEHVRLTAQGHLLESAAIGSEVDVQLASLQEGPALPGETQKRVHGRLTSADRVEVQP